MDPSIYTQITRALENTLMDLPRQKKTLLEKEQTHLTLKVRLN